MFKISKMYPIFIKHSKLTVHTARLRRLVHFCTYCMWCKESNYERGHEKMHVVSNNTWLGYGISKILDYYSGSYCGPINDCTFIFTHHLHYGCNQSELLTQSRLDLWIHCYCIWNEDSSDQETFSVLQPFNFGQSIPTVVTDSCFWMTWSITWPKSAIVTCLSFSLM